MPDYFELGKLNLALRGRLLRDSLGEIRQAGIRRREDAAGNRTDDRRWTLQRFDRRKWRVHQAEIHA